MSVQATAIDVKLSGGLSNVYSGLKFQYYDREDRLYIVSDFLKTVELEYALLPLKKIRLNLDFNKLKEDAIRLESKVEDILILAENRSNPLERERISFLQAQSNMAFLDRMQNLVAQFHDTHFGIQEKIRRPLVYTGIRLFRIDGKVVVGGIEKKLMDLASKLSGTDFSFIKLGDEVNAIDGVPVEDKISDLKESISASSDEFADYQAIRSLTIRDHHYAPSNTIKISFKSGAILKLPLFANSSKDSTPRLDAMIFFAKYGIPYDTTAIGLDYDNASKQWLEGAIKFEGYSPTKLHLNLKGLTEMMGDDGTPALRSGYYISKGRIYGVLQILTFSTKNVKIKDATMSFIDGVRAFIAELKENQTPLILDLRFNPGGRANLPPQVLSVLAEENTVYPTTTTGYRMTSYIRQLQEPQLFQQMMGEDLSFGINREDLRDLFEKTIESRLDYTPMFSVGAIPFDKEKINGFSNKIVALVTANCISGCDMMAMLLKASKRATIIGTHSNGTGAGYSSTQSLNTNWVDRLRVFDTQIPNFLFGMPGEYYSTKVYDENSALKMCSENLPTEADIPYAAKMIDLTHNSMGWLQVAAKTLDEMN
jgi:hypothetical protein